MRRETSGSIDICTWVYKRELSIGSLKRHKYNKGKLIAREALEALGAYNHYRARGMAQMEVCGYMDMRCQYVPRICKHTLHLFSLIYTKSFVTKC